MKKLFALLIVTVMMISLTACGGAGVDLKCDYTHMNGKVYTAHMGLGGNDKVTEFDKDEPNFARIENADANYVLDVTLDTEAKEAYEQFQTSAKESDMYKEVTFGKFKGYYADDGGDIYGYVLLDESDETFNVFVNFVLYLNDEASEKNDVKAIFDSSDIQDILKGIEFKAS